MIGNLGSTSGSAGSAPYDYNAALVAKQHSVAQGQNYTISNEQLTEICEVVAAALASSDITFSAQDRSMIANIFEGSLANIAMLPRESDLRSELVNRIQQHAHRTLNLSDSAGHDAKLLDALSHAMNSIVFIPESKDQWSHPSGAIRLFIKERGEAVDRTSELIAKHFGLNPQEEGDLYIELLACLIEPALTEQRTTPEEGMKILEEALLDKAVQFIEKSGKSSPDSKEIAKELNKEIFSKSMAYAVKQPQVTHKAASSTTGNHQSITGSSHMTINKKYEHGEEIPRYIMDFDVTSEHIMNPEGYLDVRLARKAVDSMKFVSGFEPREDTGKNIEVFIGPEKDMRHYYEDLGYSLKGELAGRTTNRYYYFENPDDPKDAKVIITGASNSSKLFHQLIQLKFAGIDLEKVGVRGLFSIAQKDMLDKLDHNLKSLEVPPTICFIGNRSLIVEALAERLFPDEMETVSYGKSRDAEVEKIYERNGLTLITTEVSSIKYSYVAIPTKDGSQIGIMGMRMPNGSLAGNVTEKLMQNGVQNLFTVGAGGSLDKKADISSYQLLTGAMYQDEEIALDSSAVMDVPFSKFEPIHGQKNITVDSPLVENKAWLHDAAAKEVNSVDVESYHILKAFVENRTGNARILPGIFTSDVVEEAGEHTLEEKIAPENAWKKMGPFLQESFDYLDIITKEEFEQL